MISSLTQKSENSEQHIYPPLSYGWYVTVLLTIIYILSFVDRQILSLLVEPIKSDMNLSDTQIGLLMGASFAIFYSTMGLPLGWLADNMPRKYLLGAGLAVWSAATALSGLAQSFKHLFIARILVGAGEASLGPCAISLISDVMPPSQRSRAIAVYSSALSFALAIAYLLGGQIMKFADGLDLTFIPFMADLKSWQLVLIIVGSPGLLIALLVLTLKEPNRQYIDKNRSKGFNSIKRTFNYFGDHKKLFTKLFILPVTMTIITYSHNFIPSLFQREYGWDPVTLSIYIGTIIGLVGPCSTFFGGWLIDKMHSKGIEDASIIIMRIGGVIMVPTCIAMPLMPSPQLALVFYGFSLCGVTLITVSAWSSILGIVPPDLRGQATAIYLMVISMFGLMLGPTLVGVFNDFLFVGSDRLDLSMSLVSIIFGTVSLIMLPNIVKTYRAAIGIN